MTAVLILMVIFGGLAALVLGPRWLGLLHEQRMRELELRRFAPPALPPPSTMSDEEKKQLEERIRTLETIVCSVDYELNAKLNRLATRQLQLLPPPKDTMSTAPTIPSTPPPAMPHGQQGLVGGGGAKGPGLEHGHLLAGRFLVDRRLGSGGMGAVYLARDEKLGELVAVKVVHDVYLADPMILERFKREVTAARRIHHPNVVRLHDLGEEAGLMFLSMEYVEGESLAERIRGRGPLAVGEVRALAEQLCSGMEAAHEAGIIHRDLKPANVLLDRKQLVKIIDFGVAKLAHLEGMTATSLILGTPEYMAPEQIRGGTVDARSDLYAMGIVLYEALTGRTPFKGESPIAIGFAACTAIVPPLRDTRAEVPDAWDVFVRRALAKDPAQRFASAAVMRASIPS